MDGILMPRKFVFSVEYIDLLKQHMESGKPFKTFHEVIGCSYSTVFRWTYEQKEFEATRKECDRKQKSNVGRWHGR